MTDLTQPLTQSPPPTPSLKQPPSNQQADSPPPTARPRSSSVLTFDPDQEVPYLNPELIMDEYVAAKEKDEEEFESILTEFQQLSKEFVVWSTVKLNRDDEKYWGDLVQDEKVVLDEQDVQEGSREVIRTILAAVKNIFSNW